MEDVTTKTRHAVALFDGSLEVGNHDSITLLGASAQMKLRDYSRSVSKLFVANNDELNNAIEDVVAEIEKFENRSNPQTAALFGTSGLNRYMTSEYNKLTTYIEQVSLFFQLQQAQLLKEIKLLEKLGVSVQESAVAIAGCIERGTNVLSQRTVLKNRSVFDHPPDILCDDKDSDVWYSRLERRVDDLQISHTVALQCQTQIKILQNNNLLLLDRLSAAITNIFPVWESQMATLLGIEVFEKHLQEQEKVFGSMKKPLWWKQRKASYRQRNQRVDIARVSEVNSKLRSALQEAASLEMKDTEIRCDFKEIAKHMERG